MVSFTSAKSTASTTLLSSWLALNEAPSSAVTLTLALSSAPVAGGALSVTSRLAVAAALTVPMLQTTLPLVAPMVGVVQLAVTGAFTETKAVPGMIGWVTVTLVLARTPPLWTAWLYVMLALALTCDAAVAETERPGTVGPTEPTSTSPTWLPIAQPAATISTKTLSPGCSAALPGAKSTRRQPV
jgi:hypothetical protein